MIQAPYWHPLIKLSPTFPGHSTNKHIGTHNLSKGLNVTHKLDLFSGLHYKCNMIVVSDASIINNIHE